MVKGGHFAKGSHLQSRLEKGNAIVGSKIDTSIKNLFVIGCARLTASLSFIHTVTLLFLMDISFSAAEK